MRLRSDLEYSRLLETTNSSELTYEKINISVAYSLKSVALFKSARSIDDSKVVETVFLTQAIDRSFPSHLHEHFITRKDDFKIDEVVT